MVSCRNGAEDVKYDPEMYARNKPVFFTATKENVYYWGILHFIKLGNVRRVFRGSGCLSLVFHRTGRGSILCESYAIFGGNRNPWGRFLVRLLRLSATLYSRRNVRICYMKHRK